METLDDRRESLCLRFALKCTKNPTTKHMFAENKQKKLKQDSLKNMLYSLHIQKD